MLVLMKSLRIFMTAFMLISVIQLTIPDVVNAQPNVKLDYGTYKNKMHHYWFVDLGSLKRIMVSHHSTWEIKVSEENDYYNSETRIYQFHMEDDRWEYRYKGWTGKGGVIPMSSWKSVSSNRLANDILYIINNH